MLRVTQGAKTVPLTKEIVKGNVSSYHRIEILLTWQRMLKVLRAGNQILQKL